MRRGASILFAAASIFVAPIAAADPPPPWLNSHYPDWQQGQCAGGRAPGLFRSSCDGEHYPDGTFWRQVLDERNVSFPPVCLLADGSPQPPPAPRGGCGGNA